jgi:hypothetical protein
MMAAVLSACARQTPEQQGFAEANGRLTRYEGVEAFGNTPDARSRAQRFSTMFSSMREVLFTKGRSRGPSISEGHFLTHCEMRDGRVAFLVHVPKLRNFTQDAQAALLDTAWAAARVTISDLPRERLQLAVGLRGALIYGEVGVGPASAARPARRGSMDDLFPFFTGSSAQGRAAADPPAARPTPAPTPAAAAPPDRAGETSGPRPLAAGAAPNGSFGPDQIALPGQSRASHPSIALFNAVGHGLAVSIGDGVWVSAIPISGTSIVEAVDASGAIRSLVPFLERGCEVYYRDEQPSSSPPAVATVASVRRGPSLLYGLEGHRAIETAVVLRGDQPTRGPIDATVAVTRADLGRVLFDERGRLAGVVCLQGRRYTLHTLGDVPAVLSQASARADQRRREGFTLPSPTTLFIDRF